MSCDAVRPLLFRVAEGEACPDEALAVARHVPACTSCRILLARERRLADHLENDLEDLAVGEEFVRSVMDEVGRMPRPRPRGRRMKLAALAGLGVGVAAVAARITTGASAEGLRVGLLPSDGVGSVDGTLPAFGALAEAARVVADTAATLVPAAGDAGTLVVGALVVAALVATGALAVGSTIVAVAAGSVLRLVR